MRAEEREALAPRHPPAQWQELMPLRRVSALPPSAGGAVDNRATVARNWRRMLQRPQQNPQHACSRQARRRLTMALAGQALRDASLVNSDVLQHLRPRTIVLVTDTGPNPDDVIALLTAATLHLQEQSLLAAVICNGGGVHPTTGLKEARNRAALARCILDYFGLHDVPVGIGEPTAGSHQPWPHEYDFPGFASVEDSQLCDGQELLVQTLELVEHRSLTLVVISALSDVARLIASHPALVRDKVECLTVMGGVQLEPTDSGGNGGGVRTFAAPVFLRPDHAANNNFDPPAAAAVYSWFVASAIPLRVVSREMVPNIPHRIVRAFASKHPYDPVMRYLKNASDLGLVYLWRRICRGEVPNRDKRWFFLTFCGVSPAEFERLRAHELGENFPIGTMLDGTVKSYDVVTLLLALHDPSDLTQQLFPFDEARVVLNGAAHFLFVHPRQLVPAQFVIEHLERVYQLTIGIGKWSVRGRLQQTRVMLGAAVDALCHQVVQGHAGWVMCGIPCIVHRRETICSGSRDGTMRLWDVWTGGCVKVLRPELRGLAGKPVPAAGASAAAAAAAAVASRGCAAGAPAGASAGACNGGGASGSTSVAELVELAMAAGVAEDCGAKGGGGGAKDGGGGVRRDGGRGSASSGEEEADDVADVADGADLRIVGAARPGRFGLRALLAGAQRGARRLRGMLRRPARAMQPAPAWVTSVAKCPSHTHADTSTFFLGLDDGTVKVWSVAREGELSTLLLRDESHAHPAQVSSLLIVDGDQSLLSAGGSDANDSAGGSNQILQWDLKFSLVVAVYEGHSRWVRSMVASSDGLWFFSGSNDGTIRKWRVHKTTDRVSRTAARIAATLVLRPAVVPGLKVKDEVRREWIRSLAHAGRHLFSGGNDGLLRRWDSESGVEEAVYHGHKDKLTAVAVPQREQPLFVFSGSNDCFILQWSIERRVVLARIECRTAVTFISLALDTVSVKEVRSAGQLVGHEYRCRLFSGHYDSTMLMWDTSVVIDAKRAGRHASANASPAMHPRVPSRGADGEEEPRREEKRDGAQLHGASPPLGTAEADSVASSDDEQQGGATSDSARSRARSRRAGAAWACAADGSSAVSVQSAALHVHAACQPQPACNSACAEQSGAPQSAHRAGEEAGASAPHRSLLRARAARISLRSSVHGGPDARGEWRAEPTMAKTVPRSSAAKFTHTPASSVLTAVIDGPMVTLTAVLYAISHPMWNLTDGDQLRLGMQAVFRWLGTVVGRAEAGPARSGEDEYASFLRMYCLSLFFAVLSVVLFFGRLHERCVYALRSVDYEFVTDFLGSGGLGSTHVVYATWHGRALYYVERFLVYFIIMLGGAGFFVISRYLLMVIECADDGVWRVNSSIRCFGAEHMRFLVCSCAVFPVYILVACRMSASYNDVTYLSEVEDELPSSAAKLRQLLTFWGSTVVKRAGLWTRHPVHGWKFGLTGRLCILINWIADLLIEGFDGHGGDRPNQLRWISVGLWVLTAYVLVWFTLRYQPMAEPFSSKVLVLWRAVLSATYLALALTCALVITTGADSRAPQWRTSAAHSWSLLAWALIMLITVPACWTIASRWDWQKGNEFIAERQAAVLHRAVEPGPGDAERRTWGLGSFSLRQPSPVQGPRWNKMGKQITSMLRLAPSPPDSRDPSPASPNPRLRDTVGVVLPRTQPFASRLPDAAALDQPITPSPRAQCARQAVAEEERPLSHSSSPSPRLSAPLLRRIVASSGSSAPVARGQSQGTSELRSAAEEDVPLFSKSRAAYARTKHEACDAVKHGLLDVHHSDEAPVQQ